MEEEEGEKVQLHDGSVCGSMQVCIMRLTKEFKLEFILTKLTND